MAYEVEESAEFRVQLLRGFLVWLKKGCVAGKQKSSKPGLFVDHEPDQVVSVGDHPIGVVNPASTAFYLPEPVSHGQGKQAQGDQWQYYQTEKQTSIRGSFQKVSRSGPFTL